MVLEGETKQGNLVAIILNYVHCYFELIIVIVTFVCVSCGAIVCNKQAYGRQWGAGICYDDEIWLL